MIASRIAADAALGFVPALPTAVSDSTTAAAAMAVAALRRSESSSSTAALPPLEVVRDEAIGTSRAPVARSTSPAGVQPAWRHAAEGAFRTGGGGVLHAHLSRGSWRMRQSSPAWAHRARGRGRDPRCQCAAPPPTLLLPGPARREP
eukprot:scaffold127142_cov35-Tisochrysis_lutea.AAC.3